MWVFSDDINWCKENLNLTKHTVYYINWNKAEDSYIDMQLMSLCKHNIIPNSSFSWWGAWLNKNKSKIVLAPKYWFTKESNISYEGLVPNDWVKIDNEY